MAARIIPLKMGSALEENSSVVSTTSGAVSPKRPQNALSKNSKKLRNGRILVPMKTAEKTATVDAKSSVANMYKILQQASRHSNEHFVPKVYANIIQQLIVVSPIIIVFLIWYVSDWTVYRNSILN